MFWKDDKMDHICNLNWWCDACKKIFCPECAPVPKCPKCGGELMYDS